jgi:hypothetical protein
MSDHFFCITIGVELDRENLFETYRGVPEHKECGHDAFYGDAFCNVCGLEKPSKETMMRLNEDAWPNGLLQATEKDIRDGSVYDEYKDVDDISHPHDLNAMNLFVNGLNFYAQHRQDNPRIFLGKKIAHIQSGFASDGNKWTRDDFQSMLEEVDKLLSELDVNREARIIMHGDHIN